MFTAPQAAPVTKEKVQASPHSQKLAYKPKGKKKAAPPAPAAAPAPYSNGF